MLFILIISISIHVLIAQTMNTRYMQEYNKKVNHNYKNVLHNSRNAHPSHSCNQIKINHDIYVKEWLASKKSDMSKPIPYYVPESKKCR